jgi:hypothetical protein
MHALRRKASYVRWTLAIAVAFRKWLVGLSVGAVFMLSFLALDGPFQLGPISIHSPLPLEELIAVCFVLHALGQIGKVPGKKWR